MLSVDFTPGGKHLIQLRHQQPGLWESLFAEEVVEPWETVDAGFYSQAQEENVQALGVKYVSVPNRRARSAVRRQLEKRRWFKLGQKWRTGCEERISVLKRRHGLARSRYHGSAGMRRWVGLGIIADNLINMGRCLTQQPA